MKSAALLLLLVVGLAAAGCGSGGKSPSVASLGGDATTTSQNAAPPVGGLSSGGRGGSGSGFAMKISGGGLKYSKCMRAHGVKDFPDPDFTAGGIHIQMKGGPGSDLNPNNPSFQRARAACQNFLPQGKGKP